MKIPACILFAALILTPRASLAQLDKQFINEEEARQKQIQNKDLLAKQCSSIVKNAQYTEEQNAGYGSLKGWLYIDPSSTIHFVNVANQVSRPFFCGPVGKLGKEFSANGWMSLKCPKYFENCDNRATNFLIKKEGSSLIIFSKPRSGGSVTKTVFVPVEKTIQVNSTVQSRIQPKAPPNKYQFDCSRQPTQDLFIKCMQNI